MKSKYGRGILLALGAAFFNGTVGILSKGLFDSDLTASAVSFYKCVFAFIGLSIIALFNLKMRKEIKRLTKKILHIAICSFLGIFVLYFFETTGYKYDKVPYIVFILLGTSVLTTFVFSTIILKEKKSVMNYIGLVLLVVGLFIMEFASGVSNAVSIGTLFAAIAGCGYGLFLVLAKKFNLEGGLALIWYFMLFGIIYLFIPFYKEEIVIPNDSSMPSLIALAILPTIGGFYCTTKALTFLEANKVQLLELTEPLFATLFSYIFLREVISNIEFLGAFLILFAIYISEYKLKKENNFSKNKRRGVIEK